MRVRMIRPAYWTDADLHTRLNAEQREFDVGLWMEADDAGFVAWDVDRIGADLYPFRPLGWRRDRLPKWLALLDGHAHLLECGRHILIPALSRHQSPPKPSYQNKRAHEACMHQMAQGGASGDQRVPAREGGSIGKEGKGFIEGAAADGLTPEATDFKIAMAALGVKR